MELTDIQFLAGLFSLIVSIIGIYTGLHIASRYRKHNNKILLYFGLGWIGMFNGWFPSAINFVLILTTGTYMTEIPYFIIGVGFLPLFYFIWMIGVTQLLFTNKKKQIMIFVLIFVIIYEFVFFYYIFTDYTKIGELQGPVDAKYAGLIRLFLIILVLMTAITGILLGRESRKSDLKESKIRGLFLYYTFISWLVATMIDVAIELTTITLPIIRMILITSNFAAYIGFLMPKFMKKIFIKEE